MYRQRQRLRCLCGFRIRGENHDNGSHHRGGNRSKTTHTASGKKTNVGDPNKNKKK